jgi:hypothetical protein
MTIVLYLLIFQACLGGFDVLWNHEYKEKLPQQPSAALEQKIHGVRELLYAFVFFALAGFEWHGYWAIFLSAILVIEIMLTAWDFIIEDQTRKLSPVERITHLILSMTGGAYIALLFPFIMDWTSKPPQLLAIDYGNLSYLLVFFGFAVLVWGIRDLIAGIHLSDYPIFSRSYS